MPSSFLRALAFIEEVGAIPECDRVSTHPLVRVTVKDPEVELAGERGRPRKKAPSFPLLLVVALELTVTSEDALVFERLRVGQTHQGEGSTT